jgi:hypothetical protein
LGVEGCRSFKFALEISLRAIACDARSDNSPMLSFSPVLQIKA